MECGRGDHPYLVAKLVFQDWAREVKMNLSSIKQHEFQRESKEEPVAPNSVAFNISCAGHDPGFSNRGN